MQVGLLGRTVVGRLRHFYPPTLGMSSRFGRETENNLIAKNGIHSVHLRR
jgi:hypothetical protein